VPIFWRSLRPALVTRRKDALFLAATPLFDSAWYLQRYPDVGAAGMDPLVHYLRCGVKENRDPSAVFNGGWYLRQNPDVRATGVNPLGHYVRHGWREGRAPNPLFNPRWYLTKNPTSPPSAWSHCSITSSTAPPRP